MIQVEWLMWLASCDIYNWQWLNFIKYIKMKEENSQPQYAVDEYVDYIGNMATWTPKLITHIHDQNLQGKQLKLKDPRHNFLAFQIVKCKSSKLSPFRTHTSLKPLNNITYTSKWKKHESGILAERQEQLQDFSNNLMQKSAKQIIQFLRGRHYFFADELINSQFLEQHQYTNAMRYLVAHRTFLLNYIRTVDFSLASTDIYASPMSALCSAYPQLIEFTTYSVGTASEFQTIRKQYSHWHNQLAFQEILTEWVEKQLFPALLESKHEYFPPNFVFALFSFLYSLYARVVTRKSPQFGEIYEMLYEDLKRNIDQPCHPKELQNFENNCEGYFKMFHNPEANDSNSESSATQQIEMSIEKSSPRGSGSKDKKKEGFNQEQFARIKKMEFKLLLARSLLDKNDIEKFLREVLNMVTEAYNKLIHENYENEDQWASFIKFFIINMVEFKFPEIIVSLNSTPSQFNLQRNILLKLFNFIPDQILYLLVQYQKLLLFKHFLHLTNRPIISFQIMTHLIQKLVEKCKSTIYYKQYLQFLGYLERQLKVLYPNENLRPLRQILINSSFLIAQSNNKPQNKTLVENLLDFSDPLREQLWTKYTQDYVIPRANEKYSYFSQLSIHRYFQRWKIDLETFTKICEFMKESNVVDQRYERRKSSVIQSLNFQYRHNRENYLQYLAVFLDSYCHPNHDKEQHDWVNLYPFPIDQKLTTFTTLPITAQFCQRYLQCLSPLYYETDIHLFFKLMLKINILNGSVTTNREETILKVNKIPDYFKKLLSNLYASLSNSRLKLIQKQVEKYFFAAQDNGGVYNHMLIELLKTIISNQAKRSQVNLLFKRLKTRYHLIPKSSIITNVIRAEDMLICKNFKVYQKCLQVKDQIKLEKYNQPFYDNQKIKIRVEVQFNRMELLKIIRIRIGNKLNREPTDIILYLQGKPVPEDKYSLSFQQVYFQQFYSQHKSKESPQIDYQINETIPPIRNELINSIMHLYKFLPNTISLLRGLDIFDEDWNEHYSLKMMKTFFIGDLQRDEIGDEDLSKVTHKLDFLLDFYISKLDDKSKYNFKPLIKFLKKNQNPETILRNYKIVYLLNYSEQLELSYDDCQQLMACLLPDPIVCKQKLQKNCQLIKQDVNYDLLDELVEKLIEKKCSKNLQFMSTCSYYREFTQYDQFATVYAKLWSKVYTESKIEQKAKFFQKIEKTIASHPDNMRDFHTIIAYQQLTSNIQFYKEVIGQITTLLLKLNKQNLTLNEMKTMEILITNISQLSDQSKIFHPILQSKELLQFFKNNIYQFSQRTQADLLNIMRIMIYYSQNRVSLIEFFEKQIREKQWSIKNVLIRSLPKVFQLQGRVGLRNPHSICYANSFLQQLYHIDLFREELLDTAYNQHQNQEQDLIYQLKKIFLNLRYGRQTYYNNDFFKSFKNIEGGDTCIQIQMDVDQFRNLLLDRIQNAIPSINNFVKRIFNGKQRSIIKSHDCEHQSKKQQEFSSLCIQVKDFSNLEDSLNSYFKPEILNGDNAYHCDECKKKVTAEKIIQIQALPPYLTFVLKRFQYVSYTRSKINTYFEFPLQDFQYFPGTRYRLKGVIVHMGISEAGHYISYAKHDNVWYQFNDGIVDEVDEERLKDNCFGVHTRGSGFSISQTKNAYVLIYQSENVPSRATLDSIERSFTGVADQYRKIVRHQILSSKQRIYFSPHFLETLNFIAEKFTSPESLHLLFWTLMSIHMKIRNEAPKIDILLKSWKILKANKTQFKYLWYENQIERVIEVFTSNMIPEYKSILIQILVDNCEIYNEHVEKLLEICLKKIYHQKFDNSGYYMFMHAMARKFEEACLYLNSQRIVGRILDIMLIGIIGEKVRQNLKKTCEVQFESVPFTSKSFKDPLKPYFKYHKWALATIVMERCNLNLHQIQKQHYIFQTSNLTLGTIFAEASDKSTIKFVSRYFYLLCKENHEYFSRLILFISDQLKEKEDSRKYMKVLKEVLYISDSHTEDRNRNGAIIFQKWMKKLYEERRDNLFLFAWQWCLSIARTNIHFRKVIKNVNSLFESFSTVSAQHLNIYRNKIYDGTYKYHQTRHPLYGIIAPTSMRQAQTLIKEKNLEMASIICDQNNFHDTNDYDGDIVYKHFEEEQVILKYDQNKLKFTKVAVHFSFGEILVLRFLDRNDMVRENSNLTICYRGDERLRSNTRALPEILIIQPVSEKIESEEHSVNSPRQI